MMNALTGIEAEKVSNVPDLARIGPTTCYHKLPTTVATLSNF